jgi:hypothetical protein
MKNIRIDTADLSESIFSDQMNVWMKGNVRPVRRMIIGFVIVIACACIFSPVFAMGNVSDAETFASGSSSAADEIWGYVVEGCEKAYTGKQPITDIGYFRAVVNYKGELIGARPFPSTVTVPEGVRTHLVIAELSNTALSHFILIEGSAVRQKLIGDIAEASAGFDGVQIDFESVHPDDAKAFFSFLTSLKSAIGSKILSVAVPARTRLIKDAFDYEVLSGIADRLIIMAYDEHWKGSNPGPVASIEWCGKVAKYTRTVIPREKLVMGVPLYGRSWQNNNYSKEMNYSDVSKLRSSRKSQYAKHPKVEYEKRVKVTVYYESVSSIMNKVKLYNGNDIGSIAFWRLGQGPDNVWPVLAKHYADMRKTAP